MIQEVSVGIDQLLIQRRISLHRLVGLHGQLIVKMRLRGL
jgi:hypothetical protein